MGSCGDGVAVAGVELVGVGDEGGGELVEGGAERWGQRKGGEGVG